jgi:hypothetical protein
LTRLSNGCGGVRTTDERLQRTRARLSAGRAPSRPGRHGRKGRHAPCRPGRLELQRRPGFDRCRRSRARTYEEVPRRETVGARSHRRRRPREHRSLAS